MTTIEGLNGRFAETVQAVWADLDVPQCGYWSVLPIMSATTFWPTIPNRRMPTCDAAMSGQSSVGAPPTIVSRGHSRSREASGGLT